MKPHFLLRLLPHADGLVLALSLVSLILAIGSTLQG